MIAAEQRGCIVFRCNKSDAIWPAEWNCITQADKMGGIIITLITNLADQKYWQTTNNNVNNKKVKRSSYSP